MKTRNPGCARLCPPAKPAAYRRSQPATGARAGAVIAGLAAALLVLASCGGEEPPTQGGTVANDAKAKVDTAKASACATRVTVLFWPRGHPAVPAIDFPALPMAHVELYGGSDPGYPLSAALGWAFSGRPGPGFPERSTKPACLAGVAADELGPVGDAATSKTQARLVCRLPRGAQVVNEADGPGRYRFAVLGAPTGAVVVDGVIDRRDSSVRYSTSSCRRTPPPAA